MDSRSTPERLPILMRPDEITNLKRACRQVRQSESTVRRWCRDYGISRKATPRSPHQISAIALEMVAAGDFDALDLLREGDRSAPRVIRYIRFLGLPE